MFFLGDTMELRDKIEKYINLWNPIALLDICPQNEYEPEINNIYNMFIESNYNESMLGKIIFETFK